MKGKTLRIPDYLDHILQAIDRASTFLSDVEDVAVFEELFKEQDAVVRCLIVIGEASTKILKSDSSFPEQHSDIPWARMSAMRNRIVHDYFEVDLDIVWTTVKQDLPALRSKIQALLVELR
ncbi:DUF86 domain-containing protein [Flagellatimonas centrodinii]|uniref:HepT-like ribonuclease domain-containing protein n=1 Tax=Flagellatimonas centrodinii TaxID=2806210 RepID=UPI001FF728BC|nr:DUF86 domain-containing protein [Flagellatimonas centrodinii]ULQ46625.1 DUF86 domain-containing protein [Flagellatimonas centrodinii]